MTMYKRKTENKKKRTALTAYLKDFPNNEKGYAVIFLTAIITFIVGLILIAKFGYIFVSPDKVPPKPQIRINTEDMKEITAYFSGAEGIALAPEKHAIKKGSIENEVGSAINAIMAKPDNANFTSAIPHGTRLISVTAKGTLLTANFSKELVDNHPGGSSGEIQTVYAIVNTVALNFPQFKEVRILVEGRKTETIAGHIDISVPITPDRSTIGTKSAKK